MTEPYYHAVAFISDIHANLEAFEAVLEDINKHNVAGIYFLGDLIGYGPDPIPCIQKLRDLQDSRMIIRTVCGNHDYGVANGDLELFSRSAKLSNNWTIEKLEGTTEKEVIAELADDNNFVHQLGRFQIVHSSISPEPQEWAYIKPKNAKDNFIESKLLFVGHSHIPALYSKYAAGKDWNPIALFGNEGFFFYPPNKQDSLPAKEAVRQYRLQLPSSFPTMVINIGSVGQPRDNNSCARYVLHVTVDFNDYIEYRQVGYNVQKTVEKHKLRGLDCDEELATRLITGGRSTFGDTKPPEWFPF